MATALSSFALPGMSASDLALVAVASPASVGVTAPSGASSNPIVAFFQKPLYGSVTYGEAGIGALALAAVTKVLKVW